MNSYNKLETPEEVLKYYKAVLADVKTKVFRNKQPEKNEFYNQQIIKLEKIIKEFNLEDYN